jgi:hypothetical protein
MNANTYSLIKIAYAMKRPTQGDNAMYHDLGSSITKTPPGSNRPNAVTPAPAPGRPETPYQAAPDQTSSPAPVQGMVMPTSAAIGAPGSQPHE